MEIVNTGAILMTRNEYDNFKHWLKECCGYDLDEWIRNEEYNRITDAFTQYYREIDNAEL